MSQNYVPLFDKQGTQPGNNHQLAGGRSGENGSLWANSVIHTKLVSNAPDEDFQTGRTKPPVFTVEQPQSVNVLVDSNSRPHRLTTQRNPFEFRSTFNSNLYRSRFCRVKKVIVPKPPNINQNNNHIRFNLTHLLDPPIIIGPPRDIILPTGVTIIPLTLPMH